MHDGYGLFGTGLCSYQTHISLFKGLYLLLKLFLSGTDLHKLSLAIWFLSMTTQSPFATPLYTVHHYILYAIIYYIPVYTV